MAYGLSKSYGQNVQDPTLTTNHSITLDDKVLSRGVTYYLVAKSAVESGASVTSQPQHFATKGFDITISIVNQDKQPLQIADVTVAGKTLKTDKKAKWHLLMYQPGVKT